MSLAIKPSRRVGMTLSPDHSHGSLNYLEMGRGDAPPVILIHGFGADLLTWQFCLIPLAAKYRVIAIDLPGHGRTTADVGAANLAFMTGWLDEALDVLDVSAGHIIGHSMGAKIALGYTLAHPERVQSLGLISPAGLGSEFHHATLDAFLSHRTPDSATLLAQSLLGPKGQNLGLSLAKSLLDAASDSTRHDALSALLGQAKAYGLALSPEGFDWSKIRCPVKILWGDHDRLIPMSSHKAMPPVQVVAGAGHLPHMESPAEVVAALKEFLS